MLCFLLASTAWASSVSLQWVGGEWDAVRVLMDAANPAPRTFGEALASIGDVDLDGHPDLAIGARLDGEFFTANGAVYVLSGKTGMPLRVLRGTDNSQFGFALLGEADLNNDGRPDLLVGAPDDRGSRARPGRVEAYELVSGRLLYSIEGVADEHFGSSLAWIGDLDGDRILDFACGAPSASHGNSVLGGTISAHSGSDGRMLWKVSGALLEYLGQSMARIGDLNADHARELIVGIPWSRRFTGATILVLDGRSGQLLRADAVPASGGRAGRTLAVVGDLDRDGEPDYLAGEEQLGDGRHVVAFSGATGAALWTAIHPDDLAFFGSSYARWEDLDGDGVEEVLVGATRPFLVNGAQARGQVLVLSGADGTILRVIEAGAIGGDFGARLLAPGDLDGDGASDLVVTHGAHVIYSTPPYWLVEVWNLLPGMTPSRQTVSAAAGSGPTWTLDFPAARAGQRFGVLLSASGTGPSLLHGGLVPLSRDPLFEHSLRGFSGVLNLRGRLDTRGNGEAHLRVPAGVLTRVVGRNFHACAVAVDPSSVASFGVSLPVRVQILP